MSKAPEQKQEHPKQEQPAQEPQEQNGQQEQDGQSPIPAADIRLAELEGQLAEANDRYLRLAAEYDNFRKRTMREREQQTAFVVADTVARFLPLSDALLEAAKYLDANPQDVKEGLIKVERSLTELMTALGLTEIDTNCPFDPNLHNAVLHVQDESLPEGAIVEVMRKGYQLGERVVRHAIVSVAN